LNVESLFRLSPCSFYIRLRPTSVNVNVNEGYRSIRHLGVEREVADTAWIQAHQTTERLITYIRKSGKRSGVVSKLLSTIRLPATRCYPPAIAHSCANTSQEPFRIGSTRNESAV